MTGIITDPDQLNNLMEFGLVIRVSADGTATPDPDICAPELLMGTAGDEYGSILDEHEQDYIDQARQQGWELLHGWTGQDRYRGLVMHASEFVGGGLAGHILATPGLYVTLVVETDDRSENEASCAGWAIAYRPES